MFSQKIVSYNRGISAFMQIMMTSSNGNIFRITGILGWECTGHRWIPTQRPDIYIYVRVYIYIQV